MTCTLAQLLDELSPLASTATVDPADLTISQVTADDRMVEPGALFVAIPGGRFDGHGYIPSALTAGAVAVMGSQSLADVGAISSRIPYIQIADPRLGLAIASAAFYGFPSRDLATVGITGTDGKTTTATILESILSTASRSAAAPQGRVGVITTVSARIQGQEHDTGFHVTTPDAPTVQAFLAEMRDADCAYAIIESTSHGLAQRRVAAVAYDVAAVTNITHEHLDYHGSREAYVAAKAELFRMLFATPSKPDIPRFAVLNADDAGSHDALMAVLEEEQARSETAVALLRYGFAPSMHEWPDVAASAVDYRPDRTSFVLHWQGESWEITTSLIGDYNIQNILCAATITLGLGVEPAAVQEGVGTLSGVVGRMERMDRGQDFLAIVDFAHSPASLERALHTLRGLVDQDREGGKGRVIAVFGSAGLRDQTKRRLMGAVSGRLADFTVVTAEDPRTEDLALINAEIEAGLREYAADDAFVIVPDRAEAIQFAIDMAEAGDVVCAFGKGHERSMCFGEIEYPWSDQQAMLDALARRMGRE